MNVEKEYTEGTYEQLTYRNYGDHIEINDCNENAISVVIPAEIEGLPVTSIGYGAFEYCYNLTSITIPNNITSIGDSAFLGCSSLAEITIPDSVTSIGNEAFAYCLSLAEITIPDSVASIGDSAFLGCSSLAEITIPDSVASIGECAFDKCSSLESIAILNPECEIDNNWETIYAETEIKGYKNSTAQKYAERYNRDFKYLVETPETTGGNALIGNADCDGAVDLADIVAVLQNISNEVRYVLSKLNLANADCNSDGEITDAEET